MSLEVSASPAIPASKSANRSKNNRRRSPRKLKDNDTGATFSNVSSGVSDNGDSSSNKNTEDKPAQSGGKEASPEESKNTNKSKGKDRRKRYTHKVTQRRQELDELRAKYKVFSSDPEVFTVMFSPSEPDFPFSIPLIELDLHISRHYPNQGTPPYIKLQNEDIPKGNAINIESAFLKYEGPIAEKISKLDKNLEALLTLPAARTFTIVRGKKPGEPAGQSAPRSAEQPAAQPVVNSTNSGKQLATNVQSLKLEDNTKAESDSESDSESESDVDSESSDEPFMLSNVPSDSETEHEEDPKDDEVYAHSSDEEDVDSGIQGTRNTDKPKREGTELIFHDIKLTNIALLEVVSLNILFQCGRCKTLHTFNNLQSAEYGKPSKPRAELCSKCDLKLMAAFRKEYIHSMCHTAGYLDVDGGKVVDLLPSSYVALCGHCQTPSAVFKNVDMGAQRMMVCRHCHAKMWIQLELFEFVHLSSETLAPAAKKVELAKLPPSAPKQKLNLTGGEPLSNFGACEHYRKSYRWFRFSCCQRVFACDRCHDEEMNHVAEAPSRMICGYCSREQRISQKCLYCGHDFSVRKSAFWEGGKGVRDRKLMSRKDKRKYKGRVDKSKSETHFQGKSKEAPFH